MKQLGIKHQILLLALLPSLALTLLLGTYLGYTRIQDLHQFLIDRGEASSLQLAQTVSLLSTQPLSAHQTLATAGLEERGCRAISIYDANKQLIVHAGPNITLTESSSSEANRFKKQLHTIKTEKSLRFIRPTLDGSFLKTPLHSDDNSKISGWVEIEFSKNQFAISKYQTLLISSLMILIVLMLACVAAVYNGRRFTQRSMNIGNAIERISNSQYDQPLAVVATDEMGHLEQQVNDMAKAIKDEFEDMQHNVAQSTADLRQTLETVEIQNIELNIARKEAIEASRIKSEFLANTSHEIRTPLNAITGFTKLLLKTNLEARQKDFLNTIRRSSENLLTIINDILDFSKIEAGKLVIEYIPINIRNIVEETLDLLAPGAYEKNLELIPLINADVPLNLIGDPLRIRQILTNLVNNAIKFTDQGHIIVAVKIQHSSDQDAHLIINITDTGTGMSAQQQKNIFSAFTQADSSIAREYGGTGLGLVIAKRLVEQMGGDIGIESEQEHGTTFWFSLRLKQQSLQRVSTAVEVLPKIKIAAYDPLPAALLSTKQLLESENLSVDGIGIESAFLDEIANPNRDYDTFIWGVSAGTFPDQQKIDTIIQSGKNIILLSNEPAPNGSLPDNIQLLQKPLKRERLYDAIYKLYHHDKQQPAERSVQNPLHILAVDDNEANLKLLSVLLSDLNIHCTSAHNGLEALELCNNKAFNLIFMDLQMPILDGIETTKTLRLSDQLNSGTPVIALTAHLIAEEKRTLAAAGFNDYLSKPITDSQLLHILKRWCDFEPEAPMVNTAPRLISTTAEQPVKPVVIEECLSLAKNKPDLAHELLLMLLTHLVDDQRLLTDAHANDDFKEMLENTHKLYGACCYTGVPLLREACRQLHQSLKNGNEKTLVETQWLALNTAITDLLEWSAIQDIEVLFQSLDSRETP